MKTRIIEALTEKFPGVEASIIERVARGLAKTITTEDQVADAVADVTFQKVLQSYGDSRAERRRCGSYPSQPVRFYMTQRPLRYQNLLVPLTDKTDTNDIKKQPKFRTMYRKGKLYFRYGTMGSAKTAMLLTTAYNFEERNMSYLCMKPAIDTREGDRVIHSRIGIERACEWIYPDTDIYRFAKNYFKNEGKFIEWFLIDEAQFLSEQQVDQLSRIVDDFGCNVICYGLRTDFQSHLFEGSRRLFEIADTIDEVKSTCNCGRKTIINARIDAEGNFVSEGAQVEIGGNDRYVAVCRKCWRNKRIEQSNRDVLPIVWDEDNED